VKRKVNYIGRKIGVCVCCIYGTPHSAMHFGLSYSFEQSSFFFVDQGSFWNLQFNHHRLYYHFFFTFLLFSNIWRFVGCRFHKITFYSRFKIGIKKKITFDKKTIKHTPFRSLHENFQFNLSSFFFLIFLSLLFLWFTFRCQILFFFFMFWFMDMKREEKKLSKKI